MKNRTAYVFVNGNLENCQYVKSEISQSDVIIACDGGIEMVYQLGLKPHIVVGDFDSAKTLPKVVLDAKPSNQPKAIRVDGVDYYKYPTDKYFLDTELGIDHAIRVGASSICLVNTIGDEMDHMIGTIFQLTKPKYANVDLQIISQKQRISYQTGTIEIHGEIGQKVSLIPINGEVVVKSSSGLKYDPAKHEMKMDTNAGISNQLIATEAIIEIKLGSFLIVEYRNF
jgi:thiamine pyrophosphokinase